jgi:hypothetical protein
MTARCADQEHLERVDEHEGQFARLALQDEELQEGER